MKADGIDRRRWAFLGLTALASASLVGAVFSGLYGDLAFDKTSIDPDAFSRSALGHFGFVEWLRREGYTPMIVRSPKTREAAEDVPAIVLEPNPYHPAARLAIAPLARREGPTLIVAPKRQGVVDPDDPKWIFDAWTIATNESVKILDQCGLAATIDRAEGEATFPHPSLAEPLRLGGAQTFTSAQLEPIVGEPEKILLGRHRERDQVYFLADPDLVANHGIDDPSHREFLRVVLSEMGWAPGPVMIDETVHGATFERDLWREALRMPLLPLTLSALALAIVTVLAAHRFLAPRRETALFDAGKLALIKNTAGLHGESMNADDLCRRFRAMVESDVAAHLRLPEGGSPEERRARIHARAAGLGKPFDLDAWQQEVREKTRGRTGAQTALLAIARLRNWQTEVMRGSTGD